MFAAVAGLPRDFGGSVFVVSHIGAHRSHLPELLSWSGPLPARHAEDGETIRPGIVYVAPPDRHMLVVRHGPVVARAAPAFYATGDRPSVPFGGAEVRVARDRGGIERCRQ